MKKKITGEVVLDYLKQYPNMKSLTLAKLIYSKDENKKIYKDVEAVRSVIRYYRQSHGGKNRGHLKTFISDLEINDNPFNLPVSDEAEYLPFYVHDSVRKALILSDIHAPYHNIQALTAALKYGLKNQVDCVYLNGDITDFYQLSNFCKDPRRRHFGEELETVRALLAKIRDVFPDARIYYKEGNHEERYENYLKSKAPELLGCEEFRLDVLFQLGQHRIEWIDEKRIGYMGKLRIVHGHEFGRQVFSPVNPARGFYMKAKKSMIGGHHHQTSEHSENDIDGEVTTVWSTGCLCELNPDYLPINKWNHGFAYVELDEEGNYEVSNHRVVNGRVL